MERERESVACESICFAFNMFDCHSKFPIIIYLLFNTLCLVLYQTTFLSPIVRINEKRIHTMIPPLLLILSRTHIRIHDFAQKGKNVGEKLLFLSRNGWTLTLDNFLLFPVQKVCVRRREKETSSATNIVCIYSFIACLPILLLNVTEANQKSSSESTFHRCDFPHLYDSHSHCIYISSFQGFKNLLLCFFASFSARSPWNTMLWNAINSIHYSFYRQV